MGNLMSYFFPPSKELLAPAHLRAEEDHAPATEVTEVTQVGRQLVSVVINGFYPKTGA
jgi:hypothetical protein